SLQMKLSPESARRPRQHNPLPDRQGGFSILELREEATRLARKQKESKASQREHLMGVAKQFTCSAPEPIFPTGTKAPKLTAAMLRVASTDGDALRFMGTIKGCLRQSSLSMNRPFVLLLVLVIDSSSWLRGRGRGRARERLGSWYQCMRKTKGGFP